MKFGRAILIASHILIIQSLYGQVNFINYGDIVYMKVHERYNGYFLLKDSLPDGTWIVLKNMPDSSKRIMEKCTYMNYKKNGLNETYLYSTDSNPVIIYIHSVTYSDGIKNGIYINYSLNPFQPIIIGRYKDDSKDGIWIYYNKEGGKEEFFLINGKKINSDDYK